MQTEQTYYRFYSVRRREWAGEKGREKHGGKKGGRNKAGKNGGTTGGKNRAGRRAGKNGGTI